MSSARLRSSGSGWIVFSAASRPVRSALALAGPGYGVGCDDSGGCGTTDVGVSQYAGDSVWRYESKRARIRRPGRRSPTTGRKLARAEAANQNWRAAVHCLYWAAIVMLEGPQAVAAKSRTYSAGVCAAAVSQARADARRCCKLTQLFERIWYGLRPAGEATTTARSRCSTN